MRKPLLISLLLSMLTVPVHAEILITVEVNCARACLDFMFRFINADFCDGVREDLDGGQVNIFCTLSCPSDSTSINYGDCEFDDE
jgi:hypothetical protein